MLVCVVREENSMWPHDGACVLLHEFLACVWGINFYLHEISLWTEKEIVLIRVVEKLRVSNLNNWINKRFKHWKNQWNLINNDGGVAYNEKNINDS